MAHWNEMLKRAGHLLRRSQFDRELNEEIQFHIQTRAEELEREGASPAEALERARREFGPRARMSEDSRAAWQIQWLEDLWRDLVYAARAFAKAPGFTAVAVLSLGIGVGANCAMFSLVEGTLLRLPRVPHPLEIVTLTSTAKDSNAPAISYPDYRDLRDRATSFQGIAAFTGVSAGFAARPGVEPRIKDGKLVTGNFFDVLQVGSDFGRTFLPEEDRVPGKDAVVVLSDLCWKQDFSADPDVLGKKARINGIDFTIIGVLPARFTDVDDDFDEDRPSFYLPMRIAPELEGNPNLLEDRSHRNLRVLGRLKPEVPAARARAEVAAIASSLQTQYPKTNRDRGIVVRNLLQFRLAGPGSALGWMLMTLAGAVLLVACANIAGLLTSRAPSRAREMAMRLAIGAGRPRLIRQLLTESLLLALGGAMVGVALGYIPIALARRIQLPGNPPPALPFELNGAVLAFSVAVALFSVILFGLAPAFRATRADLMAVMTGSAAFAGRRGFLGKMLRGRNLLVTAQVAISLFLLTISSSLYLAFYNKLLSSFQNPGFQVDHLLVMDFDHSMVHYKGAAADQFFTQLLDRVRSSAGVNGVSLQYQGIAPIRPEGAPKPEDVPTSAVWTDQGFFQTLAIPILKGRPFQPSDLTDTSNVAIVNDVLARRYWPNQEAIGKQIRLNDANPRWVNVVGVAKINDYMAFGSPPMDIIFLPYGRLTRDQDLRLQVQSSGDPSGLIEPIRKTIRSLDSDQAVPQAESWQNIFGIFARLFSLTTHTIGSMGILGMALALVGLYGLISSEVSTRTREIAIRMAVGARQSSVMAMVLRQGIALAIFGIGAGLGLNEGIVRVIAAVFGPTGGPNGASAGGNAAPPPAPNGGTSVGLQAGSDDFGHHGFAALVLAVFVITIVAAWIPARRAARVDPNVALRHE
jgi:putative ABC transport system permease protein